MSLHSFRTASRARWGAAFALGLLLALTACTLDEVEIPDLVGPAEFGLSLQIQAIPDVLVADGRNRAVIQVTARDQNGALASGRQLFFAIADEDRRFADIGKLNTTLATTGGNGIAQVIYTTPPRTDATANQHVLILVRPVGSDANAANYQSVSIELRSAEPRQFPQTPDNEFPVCNFAVEPAVGPYKVNTSILFQSTSFDPDGTIVRYEWDFGDGDKDDAPDVEHHYAAAGTYSVTHVVTDDDGAQAACALSVTVVN